MMQHIPICPECLESMITDFISETNDNLSGTITTQVRCTNCEYKEDPVTCIISTSSEDSVTVNMSNRCDKCGLLLYQETVTTTTTPNLCKCKEKINGPMGWVCPVCGAGMSPYLNSCPCNRNNNPVWSCY